jgi:DNA polymerase III subunit epsilon
VTDRHLVVADVETSGLRAWDVVVEVAWHDMDTGEHGRFVPAHDVAWVLAFGDPRALEINGYVDRLAGAPQDDGTEVARLRTALTGNSLAGSNPAFDARHLTRLLGDTPWHHRLVDLASYAAGALRIDPRNAPGLARARDLLGVDLVPDHTAAGDVAVTVACFRAVEALQSLATALP